MTQGLRITGGDAGVRTGDAINSWLDVLASMLRGPRGEVSAVRDELAEHLRERVRDLMLAGMPEAEATRQAIGELGDAAALARRYQEAIAPSKRRMIMHVTAVSLGVAALAVGGAAWFQKPGPDPARSDAMRVLAQQNLVLRDALTATLAACPPEGEAARTMQDALATTGRDAAVVYGYALAPSQGPTLRSAVFTPEPDEAMAAAEAIGFTATGSVTFGELVKAMESAERRVTVRWDLLEAAGVRPDSEIPFPTPVTNAGELLRAFNASLGAGEPVVGLRLRGKDFVIAPNEHFDAQEVSLVTYDLMPIVERRRVTTETPPAVEAVVLEAIGVVQSLVHPEAWQDNGGTLAHVKMFGSKVFINAPARFQPKVRWVLEELLAEPVGVETTAGVPYLLDIPLMGRLMESRARQGDAWWRRENVAGGLSGLPGEGAPASGTSGHEAGLPGEGASEAPRDGGKGAPR